MVKCKKSGNEDHLKKVKAKRQCHHEAIKIFDMKKVLAQLLEMKLRKEMASKLDNLENEIAPRTITTSDASTQVKPEEFWPCPCGPLPSLKETRHEADEIFDLTDLFAEKRKKKKNRAKNKVTPKLDEPEEETVTTSFGSTDKATVKNLQEAAPSPVSTGESLLSPSEDSRTAAKIYEIMDLFVNKLRKQGMTSKFDDPEKEKETIIFRMPNPMGDIDLRKPAPFIFVTGDPVPSPKKGPNNAGVIFNFTGEFVKKKVNRKMNGSEEDDDDDDDDDEEEEEEEEEEVTTGPRKFPEVDHLHTAKHSALLKDNRRPEDYPFEYAMKKYAISPKIRSSPMVTIINESRNAPIVDPFLICNFIRKGIQAAMAIMKDCVPEFIFDHHSATEKKYIRHLHRLERLVRLKAPFTVKDYERDNRLAPHLRSMFLYAAQTKVLDDDGMMVDTEADDEEVDC